MNPLRLTLVSLPFLYFPRVNPRFNYTRPPLGVAYLAAYVRERAAVPVTAACLDLLTEPGLSRERVLDRILATRPDIVGFSVATSVQPLTAELATELRRRAPHVKVVAGGPHITTLPDEDLPGVDAKIVGEGEESLAAWLAAEAAGDAATALPGVRRYPRDGSAPILGPRRPWIADIDTLPFPARDLLPGDAYHHVLPYRGVRRFTTLMTSRGCPFNCNFCGNEIIWGRTQRFFSVDYVLREVADVVDRHRVDLIFFEDDTFTTDRRRALTIMERLRRERPGLRWICHTRVDRVDDELAAAMAASGCVEVQVGIESGCQEVLDSTGKGIDLGQARAALRTLRAHGINVWATFVLGHETETKRTLEQTYRAAVELNPLYASFIVLLPFPGTAVYRRFAERGFLRTRDWARYTWYGRPVFATDHLDPDDLIRARARANRVFYLRPAKLFELARTLWRAGSIRGMARNVVAWLSLVRRRA